MAWKTGAVSGALPVISILYGSGKVRIERACKAGVTNCRKNNLPWVQLGDEGSISKSTAVIDAFNNTIYFKPRVFPNKFPEILNVPFF